MQKGFIMPLALAILLVAAVFAGTYFSGSGPEASPSPSPGSTSSPHARPSGSPVASPQVQGTQVMEFTMAGYMNAVKTDKLVVLYFYANWCPICRVSFPKFQTVIADTNSDRVIAFRVNYNDSDTTEEEKTAAKTFQVGSQHTVVIVKRGEMALKTDVSGWDEAQLKATIEEHLR